jgi:hypothetical protein
MERERRKGAKRQEEKGEKRIGERGVKIRVIGESKREDEKK